MGSTGPSEEKVWEKPWTTVDLINNATSWSLAGDAGLLLSLKKFSENLVSKTVGIEKELQKLAFEQEQCHLKIENATSKFLMLENTQFIENRVYDDDPIEAEARKRSNTIEKQEKTKEEKEQELYLVMKDALNIGMSIMDNYFDKIDPRKARKDDDDEYDAQPEYSDDEDAVKDNPDIVIYESKDQYVLHDLPYIIGTQDYLENDHVGLRDVESEGESENEEDDNVAVGEDQQESDETASETGSEEETESEQDTKPSKTKTTPSRPQTMFEADSDGDDDLFKSSNKRGGKKERNIFDDSDEESDDSGRRNVPKGRKETAQSSHTQSSQNTSVAEEAQNKPVESEKESDEEKAPSKPLDFAAELARKLAMKSKQQTESKETEREPEEEVKPPPVVAKKVEAAPAIKPKEVAKPSNIFDQSEDDDSDDDLFAPKKASILAAATKKKKSLFDDSDGDDSEEPPKQIVTKKPEVKQVEEQPVRKQDIDEESKPTSGVSKPKSKLTDELNKVLAGKSKKEEKSESEDEKPAAPQPPQTTSSTTSQDTKKKTLKIFDDDDDDDSGDLFNKLTSSKPKIEESKSSQSKPAVTTTAKKISLFDEEDDPLFNSAPKIEPPKTTISPSAPAVPVAAKVKSIFDDDDDDFDDKTDLFKVNKQPEIKPAAPTPASPPEVVVATKVEPPAEKKQTAPIKSSIFDDDDSDDDLFSSKTIIKPVVPKVTVPEKKEPPKIIEEVVDPLSTIQPKAPTKTPIEVPPVSPPATAETPKPPEIKDTSSSLFVKPDDKFNDEDDDEDDFFSSLSSGLSKNTKQTQKKAKNSLFDSDNEQEKDDLFGSKAPTPSKPTVIDSKPPVQTPPKASVSQQPPKPVETKEIIVDPLGGLLSSISNDPPKATSPLSPPVQEEPAKAVSTSKPAKNILFDPKGLKSSNLFKKIAAVNKSESDDETDQVKVDESDKNEDLKESSASSDFTKVDLFKDISLPSESTSKPASRLIDDSSSSLIGSSQDLFGEIQVDRAFNEATVKNAQKDRIKASVGAKKRPPTQRKTIAAADDDLFNSSPLNVDNSAKKVEKIEAPPVIKESVPKVEPPKLIPKVEVKEDDIFAEAKPVEEIKPKPKSNLFPLADNDLFDVDFNTLPVKKETKPKAKSSLFSNLDSDEDIFGSETVAKKAPEAEKATKSTKTNERLFKNLGDDENDIFADAPSIGKKDDKKKKDVKFEDPLSLFDD